MTGFVLQGQIQKIRNDVVYLYIYIIYIHYIVKELGLMKGLSTSVISMSTNLNI